MIRVGAAVAGVTALAVAAWWLRPADACDPRLVVPDGFCAMVYADNVGPARHLAVAADRVESVAEDPMEVRGERIERRPARRGERR